MFNIEIKRKNGSLSVYAMDLLFLDCTGVFGFLRGVRRPLVRRASFSEPDISILERRERLGVSSTYD